MMRRFLTVISYGRLSSLIGRIKKRVDIHPLLYCYQPMVHIFLFFGQRGFFVLSRLPNHLLSLIRIMMRQMLTVYWNKFYLLLIISLERFN